MIIMFLGVMSSDISCKPIEYQSCRLNADNETSVWFQVCGQADVWGDGVVPEASAHLEGALNISFDGVYHSPVGSDDMLRPWYGSPAIVEQWITHLLN